jgi:hypothetical protein
MEKFVWFSMGTAKVMFPSCPIDISIHNACTVIARANMRGAFILSKKSELMS